MTAVAFAMRDLHPSTDGRIPAGAVAVPVSRGGCGVSHEVVPTSEGRFVVECDSCAPVLVGGSYGWSADPAGVPLTPDEIRANELAQRDAQAAQSTLLSAMTTSFVNALQSGGNLLVPQSGAAPTLKEQLAALSPEERAELLGSFTPPAAEDKAAKPATRRPAQPTRR